MVVVWLWIELDMIELKWILDWGGVGLITLNIIPLSAFTWIGEEVYHAIFCFFMEGEILL